MASLDVDGWEITEDSKGTIQADGPDAWIYCGITKSVSGPEYDLMMTISVDGEVVARDVHETVYDRDDAVKAVEIEAEKVAAGKYD